MRHRPGTAVLTLVVLAWWPPVGADELDEIRALGADHQYAEALQRLDTHLENNPRDVEARLYKGVILTRQGRTDEAIEVFQSLSEDKPQLPEPLNNMAVLHAAQGRYEQARETLLRAIALEPNYDTAHENLGDVYAKLANIAYEQAYTLNAANEGAKEKADWMMRVLDTGVPVASEMGSRPEPGPEDGRSPEATGAKAPPGDCYAIVGLPDADASEALIEWLRARGASATARTRQSRDIATYTVYLPPLPSPGAAAQRMRNLEQQGFVDIMLIRAGSLENAVSAGVYRNLDNAERRVARLRELGYEAALKPNYAERTERWIELSAEGSPGVRAGFTEAFPELRLSARPCGGT